MANLLFILGLVIVAMALASPNDDLDLVGSPTEKTSISERLDKSAMKLLELACYVAAKDENVVSSSLSLMMVLPLFNSGADNLTQTVITKFLGGTDYNKTSDSYRDFSVKLSELNPNALTVTNKVYVSDKFRLQDSFTAIARSYRSEIDSLDFSDAQAAADTMNQWADEKTKGNTKKPISPDILGNDTAVTLFNVIYFKGQWHVPFKSEETMDKDFHVSKETVVKKPAMHSLQPLNYTECLKLDARIVELPYKEKGFRMVVVLPNEVDGLTSVLEKASQEGLLNDVFRLKPATVDLDIPKFDIKSKVDDLIPTAALFYQDRAPAGGIVQDHLVVVEKSFQEAFIKVDEEGVTAGDFTGLTIPTRETFNYEWASSVRCLNLQLSVAAPLPPVVKFTVDRPFLYLILFEDNILLAGTSTH